MNELKQMNKLFDDLFPLLRSITGPGLRQSLDILKEYIPLEVEGISSGTKVFDWTIPKEWILHEAWIKDEQGNTIINVDDCNLHLINYSSPVNMKLTLSELKPYIHTLPHLPTAIPYVTSYYKERWGFCMSQEQLDSLAEGNYHVYINSEKVDGEINFGQVVLQGETKEEVLISSYLCHPSMANNELSGPIVLAFLYQRIKQWKNRRFTYRFIVHPETIGSIAYLSKYGEHLKNHVVSGAVLTCLGGKSHTLSYKESRQKNAPLNKLMHYLVNKNKKEYKIRPFTPLYGSDERQFCSPGFNLPVGQFSKMIYGQYDGYHNSLDTKDVMSIEALQESLDEIEDILKLQELNGYYINKKPYGEPMLSQYDLYPNLNDYKLFTRSSEQTMDSRQLLNQNLMLLNYSDGQHDLIDIASMLMYQLADYEVSIDTLKKHQLLEGPLPK